MDEGTLEVLLVHAEGIRHTNLIGKPDYYVLIQCGSELRRSKNTTGYQHTAIWNEKFKFKFPISEWKNLTHLQISIMNEKHLKTTGGFVGKTIIFIGGIVAEGKDQGYIELHPSPYNVVLEDTTYKGEIKLGLKFRVEKQGCEDREGWDMQIKGTRHNYRFLTDVLRCLKISWWRVICSHGKNHTEEGKQS